MRYDNCPIILMAAGDPEPVWPLPETHPRFATWSLCGVRPSTCTQKDSNEKCIRWHAGVDVLDAKAKAPVVAPEDLTIVKTDVNWSLGTRATFARTKTGLFLVFGGLEKGSAADVGAAPGAEVKKGELVGRILAPGGKYDMLHFETYHDPNGERDANSRWYIGEDPPEGLRNPVNYLQRAAGMLETLETYHQRISALNDLGYSAGDPTWGWSDQATAALKTAQQALGLDNDGIWGPNTEEAIQKALAAYYADTDLPPVNLPVPAPAPDEPQNAGSAGDAPPSGTPQTSEAPPANTPTPATSSTPAPSPTKQGGYSPLLLGAGVVSVVGLAFAGAWLLTPIQQKAENNGSQAR